MIDNYNIMDVLNEVLDKTNNSSDFDFINDIISDVKNGVTLQGVKIA